MIVHKPQRTKVLDEALIMGLLPPWGKVGKGVNIRWNAFFPVLTRQVKKAFMMKMIFIKKEALNKASFIFFKQKVCILFNNLNHFKRNTDYRFIILSCFQHILIILFIEPVYFNVIFCLVN